MMKQNLTPLLGRLTICTYLSLASVAQVDADDKVEHDQTTTIEEKTKDMRKHDGFMPFYWDETTGSVFLEIDQWDEELLYVHSLATGLGSNPVGLDRGQLGAGKVVRFHRIGPKVFLIQRNLRFRAVTENQLERKAVEESFAQSVIWGGKLAAESNGTVLVDITSLLLSDSHGVIQTLAQNDQGEFSIDLARCAVYLPQSKAFPENTELESMLTFVGKNPGNHVRQTTPTANAISLRQHHSFVKLPDDEYRPRAYDVRSPCGFITYADYASPLNAELQQRWILRHRLEKKDPTAEVSEPVAPIIYYVDAGAPQQIQEALIEGASWWNEAFESAGFKNAFQVKLLPPDAHPLDVRYNVVQWVHRSTRGWSYGRSVIDPRTGEIIKGHVTLGSLRVRQDQLLVNGLQFTPSGERCACCGVVGVAEDTTLADLDKNTVAIDVALARIRQLSSHEVGHTLGFVHNFAASTYADRASVMDYPAPRVKITVDGQLDLSDAYGVGIGQWDKLSVRFAYSQFAQGANEAEELDKLLRDAQASGMVFISDADARPSGAAHPLANLWDNGSDPIEQLRHVMRVRRLALENFDPNATPPGTTTADVAQYFTPLYLHHRYQLQAAGKVIGGYDYEYGYAGTGKPKKMIAANRQKQAIEELLSSIHPTELMIDEKILAAISPRPYSTLRDREILPTMTGRIFDPLAAARVAADLTLDELFHHVRLANLTVHSRFDAQLAPARLVPALVEQIWESCEPHDVTEATQIGRVVREALFEKLIDLVDNASATGEVRSAALSGILLVGKKSSQLADSQDFAFGKMIQRRTKQVLERPFRTPPDPKRLDTPPGSPIGSGR